MFVYVMRYVPKPKPSFEERLWSRVDKQFLGCWLWAGTKAGGGYGKISKSGTGYVLAHRATYEALKGPIPKGLDLDHLCRVRMCVNPDHLEPVTRRENVLRGDTIPAKHAAKTHCPQGHEYTASNLQAYALSKGMRKCRTCKNEIRRVGYVPRNL